MPFTPLRQKIDNALDEGRILMLGSQILIGFQWRAIFEEGYQHLPAVRQNLGLGALLLLLLLFGLLVAPVCFHNIVYHGHDSHALLTFTTRTTEMALLPFSLALGVDLFLASGTILNDPLAVLTGAIGALGALAFWFGISLIAAPRPPENSGHHKEPTPLHIRIDQALTEARMVLPGAQALLGFQFIIFFSAPFQALPAPWRLLHLASLLLVCLTVIFLVTPAAYHRLVERGEDTERFHTIASAFIVGATVPLAVAMVLDFFVVAAKTTNRPGLSALVSILLGLYFFGLWYGYALARRRRLR